MAQFTIQIKNAVEVERRLIALGARAKQVMSRALRDGAKIVQASAKNHVNTGPGKTAPGTHLKDQIKVRAGHARGSDKLRLIVTTGETTGGTTDTNAMYRGKYFYGAFVEFGHFMGKRGTPNRRYVKPHPFLGPAYQASEQQVIDVVNQSIIDGLTREGV